MPLPFISFSPIICKNSVSTYLSLQGQIRSKYNESSRPSLSEVFSWKLTLSPQLLQLSLTSLLGHCVLVAETY